MSKTFENTIYLFKLLTLTIGFTGLCTLLIILLAEFIGTCK